MKSYRFWLGLLCQTMATFGSDSLPPGVLFTRAFANSDGTNGNAVATDSAGNIYVAGSTSSAELPATPDAFQPKYAGGTCVFPPVWHNPAILYPCTDAFIAKFDPNGKLVFLTYLGGTSNDAAWQLAIANDGSIYIAGPTTSTDFPAAGHGWHSDYVPQSPAQANFIAKLSGDGSRLLYSVVLAQAWDFSPAPDNGLFLLASIMPGSPLILMKLAPDGALTGTFEVPEGTHAVAAMADGSVVVGGTSNGSDLQATAGAWQHATGGNDDGFVAKLNPDLTHYTWASFLGGSAADDVWRLAVESGGSVWAAGQTESTNFPVRPGAWDSHAVYAPHGAGYTPHVGFLVRLSADGSTALASTYLPGDPLSLRVDSAGDAIVELLQTFGLQATPGSPWPCPQPFSQNFSLSDQAIAKIDPTGQHLLWGTWIGSFVPAGPVTADPQGNIVIAGNDDGGSGQFRLTKIATPPPSPRLVASCINQAAAPYLPGPIAPGEILTIYGAGFGPPEGVGAKVSGGKIGTELGGVQVFINDTAAPLLYVSAAQINLVAPYEIAGASSAKVRVLSGGSASNEVTIGVVAASPEIFEASHGFAAILNQDGSVNGQDHPAHAGDIVSLFASGAGLMTPPASDGDVPQSGVRRPNLPVQVQCGWTDLPKINAEIPYAGEAPMLVSGALQVNFRVPDSDSEMVWLTIGDEKPLLTNMVIR